MWGECTPTGLPFIPAGSLGSSPLLRPKTEREIKRIEKSVVRFGASGWETTIYLPSHREDSSKSVPGLIGSPSLRVSKHPVREHRENLIQDLYYSSTEAADEPHISSWASMCTVWEIIRAFRQLEMHASKALCQHISGNKGRLMSPASSCVCLGGVLGRDPLAPHKPKANLISALD